MAKEETKVLKYEDYFEKASQLYKLVLEGKLERVSVGVEKRRFTVFVARKKTKDYHGWIELYEFYNVDRADQDNEIEWRRIERHLKEMNVKL